MDTNNQHVVDKVDSPDYLCFPHPLSCSFLFSMFRDGYISHMTYDLLSGLKDFPDISVKNSHKHTHEGQLK